MTLPLREELRGIEPYGAPQLDVPVALNVNENPYGPSEAVVADVAAAVASVTGTLNRYPDREFTALRVALADYLGHGVAPEQVWAANGSNEVMLQILQAFGGPDRTAVSFAPTYSMYPEYARDAMTGWVSGRRHEDFSFDLDEAAGDGVVVVDEAYAEFRRTGTPSALELLPSLRNLVVSRTMSKAFALAGARLGYLAAAPEICDAIRVVRLPYHLGAVTQAAALAALRHADELLARVDDLRAERDATAGWLTGLGLEVAESDANFVLFGRYADRHAVWQGQLDHGVLIREVGPEGWLRVSVGTAEEMAAFRHALTALGTPARLEEAR